MPVDTVAVAPALPEHNDAPLSAGETKKRKKYRLKPGTKALREVRSMQKTTSRCIPVKAFYRIVKDIANEHKSGCKLSMKGVDALHDDAEMYLTKFFARSQKRAIHAGRLTIHVDDMKDEDM